MAELKEWPKVLRSDVFKQKVKSAKVLAVGAGGIGCELLKTLVLTGFENIEVIDMDTIETSNLNRQFLFRRRHVGESKAKIAAEAVGSVCPAARIVPHQANIKEKQYDVDYFKGFSIILNGLDNLEARRHVNRLALAAEVPLIESGTAGYVGQVTVHLKGRSECFECMPKPVPKSYPVCTIRNTPDKPIHCVVWAKDLLFQRLFGRLETVTDLDEGDSASNGESSEEAEDPSYFLRSEQETSRAYAERIFQRVFTTDVERVLKMEELWKSRRAPTPLHLKEILPPQEKAANGHSNGQAAPASSASRALGHTNQHAAWGLRENAEVFLRSIEMFVDGRPDDIGALTFDKDDDLAVDFVTAAANLRSLAYGIPPQSLFDAKGMAGNIIHAIATTNAIIAGLIVVEATKILAGLPDACRVTYLGRHSRSSRRVLNPGKPPEPNPQCMVCGMAQLQLQLDTAATTLGQLVDKVLKRRLAVSEPTVMCGEFMYEEGADLEEDEVAQNAALLPRRLAQLPGGGIGHGAIVSVTDQAQQLMLTLVVTHKSPWDEEAHPDGFTLTGAIPEAQAEPAAADEAGPSGAAAGPSTIADVDDDFLEIVEDEPAAAPDVKGKRKRTAEDDAADEARAQKRRGKAPMHAAADDDDVVLIID